MSTIKQRRWTGARAAWLAMTLSGCAGVTAPATESGCASDAECGSHQHCDAQRRCQADPAPQPRPSDEATPGRSATPMAIELPGSSPWASGGGGSSRGDRGRQLNFTIGGGPVAGDTAGPGGRQIHVGRLLADTF